MSEPDSDGPLPGDAVEIRDSGDSLESVLAEEERTAIAKAEDKLQSVRKDLEDLKDRHLRKLAEFENMRKRAEREKAEYFRTALAGFLSDLLPVVDSFESALEHAPPEALQTDFGQGVALIQKQVYGVHEVDTSGPFDPNVHEAVATGSAQDAGKDAILEVLRKGYTLNGKLLRPAGVRVAVRKPGTPGEGAS